MSWYGHWVGRASAYPYLWTGNTFEPSCTFMSENNVFFVPYVRIVGIERESAGPCTVLAYACPTTVPKEK